MQDITSSICTGVTIPSGQNAVEGYLIDKRDDKVYRVAKLKDGNCWMTQNLDYNGGGIEIGSPAGWTTGDNNVVTNATAAYYDPIDDTYGNYYSYLAALAVCPSGWQLPSSNSTTNNGSFGKLTAAYSIGSDAAGSTALRGAPLYFQYGGYVAGGSLQYAGSYGYYWSSTAYSSTQAYILYFDASLVNPSNYASRYFGLSVRCHVQGS